MTLMRTLTFASIALFFIGAAQAQAPAAKSPSAVQAGTYQVEPVHTRVMFGVSHMGFSTWYGNFAGATGTLVLDPKHPTDSKLDVTVPVASISSTSAKLDDELKGADWLDTAQFPAAHFVSNKVTPKGEQADVSGDLTLHGVTKPVTLHVTFNGAGVNPMDKAFTAGFEARGTIRRSAFGVNKYAPLIGDEVELIISGAFEHMAAQ